MIHNLGEKLLQFENFELAWERIKRSDRLEVKDRLWLDVYNAQIDKIINYIIENIQNNYYQPRIPEYIYRIKTRETLRPFAYLSMSDRLLYQAIGNILVEITYDQMSDYFEKNIFAHVPQQVDENGNTSLFMFLPTNSRGSHKGQYRKFINSLNETRKSLDDSGNWWEITTDISTYYHSISHQMLRSELLEHGWLSEDTLFTNLLFKCLSRWTISSNNQYLINVGLPVGYETSDYLSTLFLYSLDRKYSDRFHYHRFVDDIHLFVEGTEENAYSQLNELDKHVQHLGLLLNSSKTTVERCTQAKKHNHVSMALLQREDQNEILLEQFKEIVSTHKEGCDRNNIIENQSELAYILYRIETRSNYLRDTAICALRYAPRMSYNFCAHLSIYVDDEIALKALKSIASSDIVVGQVRFDCVNALFNMLEPSKETIKFITDNVLLNTNDWYLRYATLALLREKQELIEYLDLKTLRTIWERSDNYYTKGICLALALDRSNDNDSVAIEIITNAFSYDNDELIFLGFYCMRRKSHTKQQLHSNLSRHLQSYRSFWISSEQEIYETEISSFFRRHHIELHPNFLAYQHLSDETYSTLRQVALDAKDSYSTNPQKYLKAVSSFAYHMLTEYQSLFGIQEETQSITEIVTNNSFINKLINEYIFKFSKLNNGERLLHKDIKTIRHITTDLLTLVVYEISTQQKIPVEYELESKYKNLIDLNKCVFISYSHMDLRWKKLVGKHLRVAFRNHNICIWEDTQIPIGSDWHDEIQKHLIQAHVIILLVTTEFLHSDYIVDHELMPTLKRIEDEYNETALYWLAVSYSDYKNYGLHKKQCVNNPEHPLDKMKDSDVAEILVKMAQDIRDRHY